MFATLILIADVVLTCLMTFGAAASVVGMLLQYKNRLPAMMIGTHLTANLIGLLLGLVSGLVTLWLANWMGLKYFAQVGVYLILIVYPIYLVLFLMYSRIVKQRARAA